MRKRWRSHLSHLLRFTHHKLCDAFPRALAAIEVANGKCNHNRETVQFASKQTTELALQITIASLL